MRMKKGKLYNIGILGFTLTLIFENLWYFDIFK